MYRWFRTTHLVVGLLAFPFVLMYGISAVQMSHGDWFSMQPKVTETTVTVAPPDGNDGRVLARALMDQYHLRGELQQVNATDTGYKLQVVRPGTVYQISYSSETHQARIRTSVAGFMGMMNRIHHLAGVHRSSMLVNIWGGWVIAVSLGLIILGLTGIYMWFTFYNERKIGFILLAISLGYSLTLILLIRTA